MCVCARARLASVFISSAHKCAIAPIKTHKNCLLFILLFLRISSDYVNTQKKPTTKTNQQRNLHKTLTRDPIIRFVKEAKKKHTHKIEQINLCAFGAYRRANGLCLLNRRRVTVEISSQNARCLSVSEVRQGTKQRPLKCCSRKWKVNFYWISNW